MSDLSIGLLVHESEHNPPAGHPETGLRLRLIESELRKQQEQGRYRTLSIEPHGLDPIVRVHWDSYVREVEQTDSKGNSFLDPDTFVTSTSFRAACTVVDACLSGVDLIMTSGPSSVFVLGRPPGHHALAHRAMGFCIFNNVAIAAQYAIDRFKLTRVAIVDFDVHHGNGTQAIFYDRDDVLFCSTHRSLFFPGTGYPEERGAGKGKGFTINRPLLAGDGDAEFLAAHDAFLPALNSFAPELLIVSAGFDAHRLDPLGGLSVTGDAYRKVGLLLRELANTHSHGRTLSVLEGGYDSHGNLDGITSYLEGFN
jgi:acetoin utilization deacetylase AcuC-like enzyme